MLEGKTVVLAGGTAGLLAALADGLKAAGACVCFGQSPERGTSQGDSREADERVSAVYSEVGKIDVLVNVVGPVPPTAFFDLSRKAWDGLLSATLDDVFLWSQAVARAMSLAGERGTIINIVCERGHPDADIAPFTQLARRGGVIALTKALAAELAERRIQVNAIVSRSEYEPGTFQAGFDDVVRAALFLCAAHGTFITGETIDVGARCACLRPAGSG